MKTIAALIAGLLLSVATFLGGLTTGSIVVSGSAANLKPQNTDTASLWTSEPMRVDREQQVLTRLPARHSAETTTVASKAAVGGSMANSAKGKNSVTTADTQNAVDPMTTGAVDPGQPVDASQADPRRQAHIEWCSRRYASYRAADNTYQPYSGARRPCTSPNDNLTTAENALGGTVAVRQQASELTANDNQAEVQKAAYDETAAVDGGMGDDAHRETCLRRYRSYDAEDNSYQPLDGGPRRQCE